MKRPVRSPVTEYMFYKAGQKGIPLSGTFELTPVCNFSCRMCYVRKSAEEVQQCERGLRTKEQWLELARQARDAGMLHLLLTGGEPTIYPDFWELYEELSHMGLILSINTNGSMLDEKAIAILVDRPPRSVNITLYGANDETYERLCQAKGMFAKVDRTITALKDAGIQVKLNCSLTPWNADDLEAMVAYAEERELILDIVTYMFPPLRRDEASIGENDRFTPEEAARYRLKAYRLQYGEEEYEAFLRKIQEGSVPPPGLEEGCVDLLDGQIRCRAGKSSFWATWDGWMTACGMTIEPKVDMKDGSFADCWEQLKRVFGEVAVSGICHSCKNQQLCHACAAMAQTETGSFSGIPTYLCRQVQEMKRIANETLIEIDEKL